MTASAGTGGPARRHVARRPVAVLLAAVVGLGGLGAVTGMALGGIGAAASAPHERGHHHDDGWGPGPRPPRLDTP